MARVSLLEEHIFIIEVHAHVPIRVNLTMVKTIRRSRVQMIQVLAILLEER